MAMNRIIFPSIDNFKKGGIKRMADLEYVIIQEKLDGCNFRVIYNRKKINDDVCDDNKEEEIQFASRTVLLNEKRIFHGYQRLIPELVDKTKRLAECDELDDKSFVVFGELIGSSENGRPIIGRYQYFDDTSMIKFFAYEIFIEKDAAADDVRVALSASENDMENIKGDDVYKVATRMDFFQAQKLLKKANFNVIPYTIMHAADYSYEKLLDFKSVLFNHNDFAQMEGYMLRFKFTSSDKLAIFKLKPENLPEFRDKLERPEKNKMDDAFLDYLSKVPYLDDDGKLLDSSYVEICMMEYHKEVNISTWKEFYQFFRNISLCCRENEKRNINKLWEQFQKLKADVK